MPVIRIGFSNPRKWFSPFSWLIKLFDGTPFSHAYIKFYSSKYDRWLIYQASSLMVNFMGEKIFDEHAIVYREFEVEVSEETMNSVVSYAIDNAGLPYNIKAVFGVAVVKIVNALGFKMDRNPFTGHGFYCSYLVGDIVVEKLGDKLPGDPNLWTPSVVYEHFDRGL